MKVKKLKDESPIEDLIKSLQIVDEDIRETAAKQPLLFVEAARWRVECMRARAKSGATMDSTRARIAMEIRNTKDEGGKKITEGALKELLEDEEEIIQLRKHSDRCYEAEEFAKLVLEAYRQRNSAIKIIAEMQTFEGNRETVALERDQQEQTMSGKVRRLLDRKQRSASIDDE